MSISFLDSFPPRARMPRRWWRDRAKGAVDRGLVLAAAPLILPLVGVLALLVGLAGGAAFYGHERVGRGGRRFRCWKLRTMVRDADAVLARHLAADPAAAAEWRRHRKLARDPRITALGRILRRTSLDELPQLWNVLRGDMALVGPRPVTAEELREYGAAADDYLRVAPGITGLWQVSGRNALSLGERIALDAAYARGQCATLDAAILLRTLPVLLRAGG